MDGRRHEKISLDPLSSTSESSSRTNTAAESTTYANNVLKERRITGPRGLRHQGMKSLILRGKLAGKSLLFTVFRILMGVFGFGY